MKIFYLRFIVIGFLLSFGTFFSQAQRSNGLAVEGKISVFEGSAEGAIIQMYQDGRRLDNYGVGADGRYKVELNYNHKFELIFEREGNFSQKIVIETAVPNTVLQSDPKFPPFPIDINLFTEIPGIDRSFSQKTVLKIYYNPNVDNFISELYYNDAQIKKLIDQAIIQSKMIGKEADYLSKLTRAEIAELRKEYNQLLESAGNEYGNEKFLAALDGFKAASKIFPNEQFPKDRISEINDLLGLIMAASELDKALAERFATLIKEADLLFNQKNYSDARISYNRALSIKPTDSYALQQVKKITDLLNKQQAETQYQELIVQGDNSFREILYKEAISSYQNALQIKPNEAYPKNKIDEINGILDNQANNLKKQANYDEAMFQAESLFEKQFYEKSLASYENALKYKPDDPAATQKISEIREIMHEIVNRIQYDKFIKTADKSYKKKLYPEALNDYKEAFVLFPDEAHPKKRIEEINKILDLKESFADLVYKADNQFISENYEASKSLYKQALEIQNSDRHSLDRVREIDGILATQSVDGKYNTLITQADELFTEKNYENAKVKYTEASVVKSRERYPKDKISEINSILQQIAKANQKYQQAIAKADGLFQQKDYPKAKSAFAAAGQIKPDETYPPEMIAKIDGLVAEQARLLAEQQESERVRLEAEAEAEKVRLAELAAAEVARLAALQAEKDKNYSDAITKADNLFDAKDYENSRNEYRTALTIKADETYPQQRIDEIGNLLAQLSAAQKAYEDAVKIGDREFRAESFDAAIVAFNDAKAAKSDENYPDEMIAKIDSIVTNRARLAVEAATAEVARLAALQAEKDKNYADAITKADNLFNEKSYDNSRNEYRIGLTIKPEEIYPQQRIDEIGNLLAQLSAAQKAYEDAVKIGDREFRAESFDASKVAFNDAKAAKSDETYPDEMIAKIDSIVTNRARLAEEAAAAEAARLAALQAEKDKNYTDAITKANNLFNEKSYDNSRNEYRTALTIKPEETYPQQRIDEIGSLLAQLSAAQKAYEDAVKIGDREFKAESFDAAKVAFNDAKAAKSDETYPDEMIAKIDSIVTNRARLAEEAAAAEAARLAALQAEKDKNYADAITKADNLFNEKSYDNSRNEYRIALTIKPDETYPQQQIDEIGNLLAQLSAVQKAYEDAVKIGDREFRAESLDAAKVAFNDAKSAKSDETYPDEMIAKIDSIVTNSARLAEEAAATEAARLAALQAEKDKNYADAITKADNLFDTKDYENSRNEYRTALTIKPDEIYPQQKIDEIGNLLAQLSAAQKAYEDAVKIGDREFRAESFDAAKVAFNDAKAAKSDETYPDEMIAKIDSIVTNRARLAEEAAAAEAARLATLQAEKDKNYADAITKADNLFDAKDYENSRNEYRTALTIKPDETYPQQRIDEIGILLAQLSASQKAYEDAVKIGDREFRAESFDASKVAFNDAKAAKSDEAYPDEMIAKIDSIVTNRARLAEEAAAAEAARLAALQAEKDKNYADAITKADNLFNEKSYDNSRVEYRTALTIKADETYPQQRIDEIGNLLAQLSAAQKAYEDAVKIGDREFRAESFDAAKVAFNDAKVAKSDETYPDEMITKIDSIVTNRARLAEEAAAAEAARLAALQAEKDKNYADAITKADNLFNEKDYDNSRKEYRTALTIKPDETYPQQRIDEIGILLAQLSATQKAYEDAVKIGDREFRAESFDAAKVAFNDAKSAKSDETYPDEMIAKIDSIVTNRARLAEEAAAAKAARLAALQAEKDKNYTDAITKGDNLFNEKSYDNSRNEYRTALTIKADETYPQQRIDEIGNILDELELARKKQELLDKNYANIIQQADRFFTNSNYLQSKTKYESALALKSDEQHPKDRILEIENILEQQKLNEEYRAIILVADGFFKTEKYLQAKAEYEKALTVKPDEQYPKNQIAKIDDILNKEKQRILAEKAAAENLQRRTQEIADMNSEIDAANVESEAELADLYNQFIQRADAFFNGKQYNVSRAWYYQALDVKANEPHPTQRIAEINKLIGNLMLSQRDRDYQGFIDLGDSSFRDNELAVARGWYNRALGIKGNEVYPKNQIADVQKRIAERMAGQAGQQFESHVAKASKAFNEKNYNVARFWYKKALGLRPNDEDVKNRLVEIEAALK